METTTYTTSNGEQLIRGQRHTIIGTDGTQFEGQSIGVSVSKGVLYAAFEAVDGDVPTTGKRRFYNIPLAALTSPRPRMFFDA